ncbi:MAG TPA: hypothetical protein VNF26_10285 [Candidatus Baltobacterales bacterium]|nr:hypothetical protein [Candidatus Baltobacterales bacterium]
MSRYMWSLVAGRNRPVEAGGPASERARWDRTERRWVERDPRRKSAGA